MQVTSRRLNDRVADLRRSSGEETGMALVYREYLIESGAMYQAKYNRWRPLLKITKAPSEGQEPLTQNLGPLPFIFTDESEAASFAMTIGRGLIDSGEVGNLAAVSAAG
jgi:hypothetical protein